MDILRNILNDIVASNEVNGLPYSYQLERELHYLNEMEKRLIRKKVLKLNYDHGTLKQLLMLKRTGIISITDFLTNMKDSEEIRNAMSDILDSDDMRDLLAELVISSLSNENIKIQLDAAMKMFMNDVIEKPELIKSTFPLSIEKNLSNDRFQSVASSCINMILSQPNERPLKLNQVLSIQMRWNTEFKHAKYQSIVTMIDELATRCSKEIAVNILQQLAGDHSSINWFFLLLILGHIREHCDGYNDLKSKCSTYISYYVSLLHLPNYRILAQLT